MQKKAETGLKKFASRVYIVVSQICDNPIYTAVAVTILALIVIVIATSAVFSYNLNFLEDIFVEAHGMLFDLIVIGVFILWLDKKREGKLEIKRYREEIDIYRGWESKEAAYRTSAAIRKLNECNVTDMDLHNVYLDEMNLDGLDFRGANLSEASLVRANLSKALFDRADLTSANFTYANLEGASFRETDLLCAKFDEADMQGADLSFAGWTEVSVKGGNLFNVDFKGVFEGWQNVGGGEFNYLDQLLDQIREARTMYHPRNMDKALKKPLQEKYPHLFSDPRESEHDALWLKYLREHHPDHHEVRREDAWREREHKIRTAENEK